MSKTLNLVLAFKWFDKIKSGEKTHEYREVKPYWQKRLDKNKFEFVRLQKGYAKNPETMTFKIKSIQVIDGKNTDLKIDSPVYGIELGERI